MQGISRKMELTLTPPSPEDARDEETRLLEAIREAWDGGDAEPEEMGNGGEETPIRFQYKALQSLHGALVRGEWRVTASLAFDGLAWNVVGVEPGRTAAAHYGCAVDLGSTTVVLDLMDCGSGKLLDEESGYNRQIRFGEDILSRIFCCKDQPERLKEIQEETCATIRELMDRAAEQTGIRPEDCISMVISGNTTMIHFLLGLDPFGVFHEPYAVAVLDPGFIPGSALGFPIAGEVYCVPGRANYLGGDIVSGMIATEMYRRTDISVFFDIGTNGELAVGGAPFLLCGAGAAGPALEGGSVSTGMRAGTGAVDRIRIDGDAFHYHVIGMPEGAERVFGPAEDRAVREEAAAPGCASAPDSPAARGICGSGLVDLLSALFLHGWVDIQGSFREERSPLIRRERRPDGGEETAVRYAPGLAFSSQDIRELIRTKAAAATMMEYILNEAGIGLSDVSRFYMTGSFGTHVDKESAVSIGMYPDVPRERIILAGNTSIEGAREILLRKSALKDVRTVLALMEYVQFGAVANFVDLMQAASALPHTDMSRYPSVAEKLKRMQDEAVRKKQEQEVDE